MTWSLWDMYSCTSSGAVCLGRASRQPLRSRSTNASLRKRCQPLWWTSARDTHVRGLFFQPPPLFFSFFYSSFLSHSISLLSLILFIFVLSLISSILLFLLNIIVYMKHKFAKFYKDLNYEIKFNNSYLSNS